MTESEGPARTDALAGVERIRRAGSVAWAIVGIAAVVILFGVLAQLFHIVWPPLILAGAIVLILNPVVNRLQARGVPRAAGAGLAYLGVLAVVAAFVLGISPVAARQIDQLASEWPVIQAKLESFVDGLAEDSRGTILEFSRQDLEEAFGNDGSSFTEQLQQAREIGVRVFEVLLILVLAPVIAFYLLVDAPHLTQAARRMLPAGGRGEILFLANDISRTISGFFRGQLVVAMIVGVLCSVGLGAIGLRFWFLIGMIAGVFNVIPLIGPWIGGIPGVTIALTTGSPLQAIGVVVVMFGAQQIDNHFITPYVMQRAVRLHPAVVILALLAGGSLLGFLGLLLAVPATAVVKILLVHLWRGHVLGEPLPSPADSDEPEGVVAAAAAAGGGVGGGGGASPTMTP